MTRYSTAQVLSHSGRTALTQARAAQRWRHQQDQRDRAKYPTAADVHDEIAEVGPNDTLHNAEMLAAGWPVWLTSDPENGSHE